MAETRISDADLSRRCRQGDSEAWRILIRRCSPLVYRVALRMLKNQQEAEDASQEVFLKIHRSFHTFDPTRPLSPWVGRITYNTCLRRLQGAKRAGIATEPSKLNGVQDERQRGPEARAASREAGDLLLEAMEGLAAQDRALLDMRYREGLSDAELAEATGMPVNTVKTRLFRARTLLKRRLGPVFRND
jgi:RNA polymerase sigma-70 factor (ECF subfamily)